MKRGLIAIFTVLLFIIFGLSGFGKNGSQHTGSYQNTAHRMKPLPASPGLPISPDARPWASDRILVKFKPHLSENLAVSCISAYRAQKKFYMPEIGCYCLNIPQDMSVEEMLFMIRNNPEVEFAEPDYKTYICDYPNDQYFSFQYALSNYGQIIGGLVGPSGTIGADMKTLDAWAESTGRSDVVVAVLDTGVDRTHPDLFSGLLTEGWNFVNDTDDVADDNGHGTFISSVIVADTDNYIGIAGAAWGCRVLPLKAANEVGEGYSSWMISAIIWAANRDVDVINLSIGAHGPSHILESALRYAYDRGIVLVSSAGNHGTEVAYPAAYDQYCLAVAATDYNDLRTEWSNHGPEIDVAAPGDRILGCVPLWKHPDGSPPYEFWWGTSISTAYVSALAALIKSNKPWLSNAEIMNIIRFTADDVNRDELPGPDDLIGWGRINMRRALVPVIIE